MDNIIIKCNKCGKALYKDNQHFNFDHIRYRCNCGTDVLIDERLFIAKHFVDTLKENNPNVYDSKEDTLNHIINVRKYVGRLQNALFEQTSKHDKSKLEEPEKPIFDEYTPKLKNCVYGSDEYKTYLKEMQVALKHHYANNRHHPEHFENGIKDMTLVDLCEMIADWKAATLRHNNGNIIESIELNQKRFNYSDELKQILINTVNMYFK